MPDPLERVRRAAVVKRRADGRYRAALLAASDAGHGYAELAHALGVSRQTVRVAVQRARERGA